MAPMVAVAADGAWLTLVRDGREIRVLDAMASWWTAVHGHGHPVLDAAMTRQLAVLNHVMFGGLTHEPAARLAQLLVDITPAGLDTVFFSDSGSVSVEVAVEDGAAVLAQPGPVRQEPPDDVARRLPRRHVHPDERLRPRRRHAFAVDRRPVPADLRPRRAVGLRPRLRRGLRGAASRARRRTRRRHRRAGGAGGRRDAVPRPALPRRPARHLRPQRRPADLRRDRNRIRAHRRDVRRRPRRRQPRHHVRRQGAHRRLHDAGRHVVHAARSPGPSAAARRAP